MPHRTASVLLLAAALSVSGCGSSDESIAKEWSEHHGRLQKLGEIGSDDPQEIEFALDRLANGKTGERAIAAWALGVIRHAPADPALRKAFDDKDKSVRANAIAALFALAPVDWAEVAARGLTDRDPFVQQTTLSKMPNMTPAPLIELIGALLAESKDESVRIGAADALGLARGDEAVRMLQRGVADRSKDVRVHVGFALGKAENSTAIPVLAVLLEDESWEVRANACQALGKYRTPEALEAVQTVVKDSNPQVRAVALRIVER